MKFLLDSSDVNLLNKYRNEYSIFDKILLKYDTNTWLVDINVDELEELVTKLMALVIKTDNMVERNKCKYLLQWIVSWLVSEANLNK